MKKKHYFVTQYLKRINIVKGTLSLARFVTIFFGLKDSNRQKRFPELFCFREDIREKCVSV